MNKYIYIITFLLGAFTTNAQIAPNLNLTDLEGNNHNIYEILDEGKTVILDFFIQNCLPCHESVPYMNDFYSQYGPEGNNSVEVISIQTNAHSDEEINLLVNEWGIDNPVVNYGQEPAEYTSIIQGFPHYIIICPNKYFVDISDFNYPSTALFWTQSINLCNNDDDFTDLSLLSNQIVHCQNFAKAYLEIGNAGTETIDHFNIDVYIDSMYHSSMELELNLEPLEYNLAPLINHNIIFNADNINGDIIEFVVNHDADINNNNNQSFHDLTDEIIATDPEITIELLMDNYPTDLSWSLTDENGQVVFEDEGYHYSASQLVSQTLNLDTNICYTFNIVDSNGDGICCDYGEGVYNLYSGEELIFTNNNFRNFLSHAFHISNYVSLDEFSLEEGRIVRSEYLNLQGQIITKPKVAGIYLVKQYFENGAVKLTKIALTNY